MTAATHEALPVEFVGVGVTYRGEVAVDAVDVAVAPGEWVVLIGPNGAGKSSLLHAVIGAVACTGQIRIGGESAAHLTRNRRAALVAFVPQNPVIPTDMIARDYVLLGRTPYIGYFGAEGPHDHAIVTAVLDRLDLTGLAHRRLGELSGGELQRVVIARALATQAPVLLLDEPTSALDIGHQQQALDLVARLRADDGLTVISAMHDLTLAGLYADRLVLLDHGRVVAAGPPADVLRADVLERHFGARVAIQRADDGTIVVVPTRNVAT